MSDPSDFESIISDIIVSPCSFDSYDDEHATVNDDNLESTISLTNNVAINTMNVDSTTIYDPSQHDVSLTDSDHSLLEVPKQLNASSPSSVCSTRPLEWDSGADVGYDITSQQQSQDMSTIERIAVSSLVYNTNSTSIVNQNQITHTKTKSNSLVNLNEIELSREKKSTSLDVLKFTSEKSDTLPKCRSPMASSLSVSTVVHKLESLKTECINKLNEKDVSLIFNQQEKRFEKLSINSNKEQKSTGSSKESNSTLGSGDSAGSWVAKEFHDSTNNTTDRVNSFEYLPGNSYYNTRNDEQEDYSDKEIKQSTKILVDAMKQNGLTNELQRKEIFKEIIESFLKNYVHKDKNNSSSLKSSSDSDHTPHTPIRQDFTSQTSNTANTIVNNPTNNHSSTITFTSPITSSRYGDDVESKYDESSMDSGQPINLQKCKIKKSYTLINLQKQKDQSVQCTIQDNLININENENENLKPSASSKKNADLEANPKNNTHSKTKYNDVNKDFNKQMIWFHKNYMKTERENQMLWINSQISHLNNLKKLLNTHEELKKNWNTYKQKQTNIKSKLRRRLPISNSSSDVTTSTYTDSTISSKPVSVTSRSNETDIESSATICDHVHYKKGILVNEPNSLKKCCEKMLDGIKDKQNQKTNKFKTAWSQTESIHETKLKTDRKQKSQSGVNYTECQLKPSSSKSSISYDIIFKPTSRCLKEIDAVNDKKKKQELSISVACQTNKIPFKPKSSLQEYLIINRPDYICRAEERQNILTNLASLRDKRKELKKDMLITNNNENKIPPNPLAVKRIMSQSEMRKLTENKYRKCPEVKNKKIEKKRKEEYKTNKLMANIFNKRLQKKTLKGKVDLSNSVSVCSL
uniref:Alstrom syndrome protein 1 n=1 Tax=Schizaphis graminum TaxID=13262 RepID=A0A2S2P1K7_SCHGA